MDPQLLKRFALFSTVDEAQLRRIAAAFHEERHPAGTVVFREYDPGEKLYLIASGTVRISQRLGAHGEEALATLKGGDYFGDMSLIDARPRSADAIVVEDLTAYTIQRRDFLNLLRTDPDLTISVLFQFIATLTARLRVNNEKIRAVNLMTMW